MDKAYTINRLQFRHHSEVFTGATLEDAREAAIKYISGATAGIRDAETGLAVDDDNNIGVGTKYGYSLFSEPTVLRYSEAGGEADPHIILAIGSVTNDKYNETGEVWHSNNRFCIIDIDKVESEIEDLWEEIANIIASLKINVIDTPSLDLESDWVMGEGIYLSGNVKTAKTHVFSGETKESSLMVASGDPEEGLFIYVDLKYDEAAETFKFVASNWDGTLKETSVHLPNNYLVSGIYKWQDESIHLRMKNGDEIVISCEDLIDEWAVEGEASKTPIVLTREEVGSGSTDPHQHTQAWQDVLRADIRIGGNVENNILEKSIDGRYLYVDGQAKNIIYYWNGDRSTVEEQLNKFNQIKISPDQNNIIQDRADGFFANTQLDFISNKNQLIFKTTNVDGTVKEKTIQLNTVDVPIEEIYYNSATEELIIKYYNDKGELKTIRIPISDMIDEWEVLNPGHNVTLTKVHKKSGKDQLSADANIYNGDNNILVDRDHSLYVKGTADNIKYKNTTVEGAIDDLKETDTQLQAAIEAEGQRAQDAEAELDNKIGTGFTSDPHENVTYKFEALSGKLDTEIERAESEENRIEAKLDEEIARSTAKDDEHDEKLAEHEAKIEAVSADSASSLKDIINNDHSIDVDKTDAVRPVIKVNLSTEVEDSKPNIIKLNNDGLYAGVDLSYEETANKLIFKTTNGTKEIQLESMSSIISITYDAGKEAIVITYMTNGHEIKTVEIPVGDLINEWRVEDGHPHAVQLEKVRVASGTTEQDILKASVVITDDHDDNVLIMDDGTLYVPANTFVTEALSGAINTETARAIAADTELNNRIDAETTRATLEEGRIESKLDSEITRSTTRDTELSDNISREVTRATNRENDLNDAITAETLRAQTADNELYAKIADETTERIAADTTLQSAIDSEALLRASGDTMLRHLIEDEEERRISGDTLLNEKIEALSATVIVEISGITEELETKINNEITRATNAEQTIANNLASEIARAQAAENSLNTALTTERTERSSADVALQQAINNESAERMVGDNNLQSLIAQEAARAQVIESTISGGLTTEIAARIAADDAERTARENADTNLNNAITAETAARIAADDALRAMITSATIAFDDTQSIDFTKSDNNVVTAKVKIANSNGNIIMNPEGTTYEGLFASVRLDYDQTTNKIQLYVNDVLQDEKMLSAGALLDSIVYDSTNRALIMTYTDANGVQHQLSFPVNELFNDWEVQNPSEKSAVELTKTVIGGGYNDQLSGRVLITDDRDGDGKPDEGSDNMIEIRNNGLYVCGSAMTDAQDVALCTRAELKGVEKAVIGHTIDDCNSGYTYEPWNVATYINEAKSFNEADFYLDQAIKNVDIRVDEVSAKTDCIDTKADSVVKLLYGVGTPVPECGEGLVYISDPTACVISGATSFNEADQMLNDQICNLLNMWVSGITCSAESDWVEDGANRKLQVDVRFSRGNDRSMTDDDITITNLSGAYIDPTNNEFTDTNALRLVCLTDAGGVMPDIHTEQNGIYLSNVWDCGLYYGTTPEDEAAKASAEEAGYITEPYTTDETATPINYMNNVRL